MRTPRYPNHVSASDAPPRTSPKFGADRPFLISIRERIFWLGATVALLALLALLSWTAKRDEANRRLFDSLAGLQCPPPHAPLEKFLLSLASEADGRPPALTCVYITSSLGTVPRLRYEKPIYAESKP